MLLFRDHSRRPRRQPRPALQGFILRALSRYLYRFMVARFVAAIALATTPLLAIGEASPANWQTPSPADVGVRTRESRCGWKCG